MSDYGNPAKCPRCGAVLRFESGGQFGGGVVCPTGHWGGYHAPSFRQISTEGGDLADALLASGLRDIAKMRQLERRAGRSAIIIAAAVIIWAVGYWAGWWPAFPF